MYIKVYMLQVINHISDPSTYKISILAFKFLIRKKSKSPNMITKLKARYGNVHTAHCNSNMFEVIPS